MSSKKSTSTPAPQPQRDPQLDELIRLQTEFAQQTAPFATKIAGLQSGFLEGAIPQAGQLFGEQSNLLGGLLRGEQAPGMFGQLGQPFGEGIESELFSRNRERSLASLEQAGLLDSGARIEAEAGIGTDIALASAGQQRSELASLLGLATGGSQGLIGQALGFAPQAIQQPFGVAGQAAGQLGGRENLSNQLAAQNFQAQLAAQAQERASRSNQIGSLFGGIGQLGAGALGEGGIFGK